MERRYLGYGIFLALIWAILYTAALIAGSRGFDKDTIYYGHSGLPAPCPPKTGYWPRDCH
jgi:hypothetical protein